MIYLLHFGQPLKHAQHYLGTCRDDRLHERLAEHARGHGAALVRAVVAARIPIFLARVIPFHGHEIERQLKRASHFRDLCPLCCPMFAKLAQECYRINPDRPDDTPPRAIWDNRPILDFPNPS
jgi:hypothetical protein